MDAAIYAWIYFLSAVGAICAIIAVGCLIHRCTNWCGPSNTKSSYADLIPQLHFTMPVAAPTSTSSSSRSTGMSRSRSCNSIAESPYEGTSEFPGDIEDGRKQPSNASSVVSSPGRNSGGAAKQQHVRPAAVPEEGGASKWVAQLQSHLARMAVLQDAAGGPPDWRKRHKHRRSGRTLCRTDELPETGAAPAGADGAAPATRPPHQRRGGRTTPPGEVVLLRLIGKGGQGTVWRARWGTLPVAVKVMTLPGSLGADVKRDTAALMELAVSGSLAHPNLVHTYQCQIRAMRPAPPFAHPHRSLVAAPASLAIPADEASPAAAAAAATAPGGLVAESSSLGEDEAPISDLASFSLTPRKLPAAPAASALTAAVVGGVAADGADWAAGAPGKKAPLVPVPPAADGSGPHGTFQWTEWGAFVASPQAKQFWEPHAGVNYELRLLMELCDSGSLSQALRGSIFALRNGNSGGSGAAGGDAAALGPRTPTRPQAGGEVDMEHILLTALDVARGMGHVHQHNVVHGDLKPHNIILQRSANDCRGYTAKICDFGLSLKLADTHTHVSGVSHGTHGYRAPEVQSHQRMFKSSDVYAYGLLLWEMHASRCVLDDMRGAGKSRLSREGMAAWRPTFPDDCHSAYVELAMRCWDSNPFARPTFDVVIAELTTMLREHGAASSSNSSNANSSSRSISSSSVSDTASPVSPPL